MRPRLLGTLVVLAALVPTLPAVQPAPALDAEGWIPALRPSAWYLARTPAEDFQVSHPEAFDDYDHFLRSDLFFSLDVDVETAWQGYLNTNPLKVWSNRRAFLQAAWSPSMGQLLDREAMATSWPGFEEGMHLFVDMSSLPWAVSNKPAMMVALRVLEIDHEAHRVVFRYLEGTPSYGEQVIQLEPGDAHPDSTAISHLTWFQSESWPIRKLYPSYHRKMIRSMHAHFKMEIEGDAGR